VREVRLAVTRQDKLLAETSAPPMGLVVFGASGDLVRRKLVPSLFRLYERGLIGEQFYVLGAGRTSLSDEQFRRETTQAIKPRSGGGETAEREAFAERLYYISGDYGDISLYAAISARLSELNARHDVDGGVVFYLAVPPVLYETIVEHLGSLGMSCGDQARARPDVRLVVEKPFGRDLDSAVQLDEKIHRCFDESQVYRIDHYLGKETVQNILLFRFANSIFEPIWNRNYIDHVQITIAESVGVEHRASYYDKSGALRDIFQNHALQMLSLAAMEPPASFEADSIRDEKVKLLRSIRPIEREEVAACIVRGQYGVGRVDGRDVVGYRSEAGVAPGSMTETYVAGKVLIDNWRWKDVPFYLRTGKRLAGKDTEIAITFKQVPHSMFRHAGIEQTPPNVLVLQIQPREGISLDFQAKQPDCRLCMSTLTMCFSYEELFGTEAPEAYQRLLLDCMMGDQSLFTRQDAVEASWQLLMPVLEAWEHGEGRMHEYPAGAESFPAADRLIESDGRRWRAIEKKDVAVAAGCTKGF